MKPHSLSRPQFLITALLIFQLSITPCSAVEDPFESTELRIWTNKEGKTLLAKLQSASDDSVTIEREDGKTFELPLSSLSRLDIEYIQKSQPEAVEAKPPVTAPPLPADFPKDSAIEALPYLKKLTTEPLKFNVEDAITGEEVSFEDLRGSYVYLHVENFDQSSAHSLMRLKLLHEKYGDRGFQIITISGYQTQIRYTNANPDFSDPKKTQIQFEQAIADYGIDWIFSYEPEKTNALATQISKQSQFAWLIGPDGCLIHSRVSWYGNDNLAIETALKKIFGEGQP